MQSSNQHLLFVLVFIISHNQDGAWHYELNVKKRGKKNFLRLS